MKTLLVLLVLAGLGFAAAVGFGYVNVDLKVDEAKTQQGLDTAKAEGAKQLNKALEGLKVK